VSNVLIDAAADLLHQVDPSGACPPLVSLDGLTTHRAETLPVNPATGAAEAVAPMASPNLPDAFWSERERLGVIRAHAHARAVSADALLAIVLARVAAMTPTCFRLPPIVGARGSLNFASAIIGPSGAGKSSARALAAELLPITDEAIVDDFPLGSGEGLVEAFFEHVEEPKEGRKGTQRVKRQTKWSVFAHLDEGQVLGEVGNRKGSTILQTIRSAWSGFALGQGNASAETKRILPAFAYRVALVANFQTAYGTALLDDAAGGTPQRFLFASAVDPSIPTDYPTSTPPKLRWAPPPPRRLQGIDVPCDLSVDPAVAREIWSAHVAVGQGEACPAELDAHRNYVRLKVAALLALLDDRLTVTADDWRVAEIAMDTSDAVRETIIAHAAHEASERARAKLTSQVQSAAVLEEDQSARGLRNMVGAIARHVHSKACVGGHKRRCLTQAPASRDRKLAPIDDAIDEAVRLGWIIAEGDTYVAGEVPGS
jgi:hypothetical protein